MRRERIRIPGLFCAVAMLVFLAAPPAQGQKEPLIQQVRPTSGPPGTQVDITGRHFRGKIEVRLGETVLPIERSLPNRITVRIPEGAASGRITVKTPAGKSSPIAFRVDEPLPAPEITGFEPLNGPPGTQVTIRGRNFAARLPRNIVMIGEHPVVVRYASPVELQVIVPESARTGPITVEVTNAGVAKSQEAFEVSEATRVFDFQPRRGGPGTRVTLSGSGFSTRPQDNRVFLNNERVRVIEADGSKLVVEIPKKASSGPLLVDVKGAGRADTKREIFTVQYPPTVVGFSPPAGPPGAVVTLRGTNFGNNPQAVEVRLGELPLEVREASDIRLTFVVGEGAADGKLSVTVNGVGPASSKNTFGVLAPLSVTGIEPSSGPAGSSVTLRGTGFSSSSARNRVTLADRPLQVISAGSTKLVVRVSPGSGGPIAVSVRGSGTAESPEPFVVTVPPRIDGFSPGKAAIGDEIEIRGDGFGSNAGTVKVTLGGHPLEVSSVRDDLLKVRLTPGSGNGRLEVSVSLQGSAKARSDLQVVEGTEKK